MYLLEIKPNSKCDGNCWFCIDRENVCKNAPLKSFLRRLDIVVKELQKQDLISDYFISGGEPTFYPKRLEAVLAYLHSIGAKHIGLTTSGRKLSQCIRILNIYPVNDINISRHCPDTGGIKHVPNDTELKKILNYLPPETDVSVNCVMQKGIDFAAMEQVARDLGVSGITFLQATNVKNPIVRIDQANEYCKSKKYKKGFHRKSWHCQCNTFLDKDNFWIRTKHTSLPRVLKSSSVVVNQFTVHSNGALTADWKLGRNQLLSQIA